MKIRHAGLSVCTAILLVTACQPRTKTKIVTVTVPESPTDNGTDLVDFKKQASGTPLIPVSSDPICSARPGAQPLKSSAVQGAYYGYQDLNEQTIAVTTKVIDNQTFEREITNKTDLVYSVKSDKKEIFLCSESPAAGSIEVIAQKIQQASDQAASFYSRLESQRPDLKLPALPAIGIGINPQYKKDIKRVDLMLKVDGSKTQSATQTISTETDNAFYSPFADETLSSSIYAVSIIPQSIEARDQGLYNGKALWEFPVVFQHEFGHHVFQMLFGDSTVLSFVRYMDYWQQHPNLHRIHASLANSNSTEDSREKQERRNFLSSPGYIFSSMNEGFADLYAYYSLGEKSGLFDITCFSQTREVTSPVMYGGIAKVWSQELWSETFDISTRTGIELINRKDKTPIELCSIPSFDDIHIVGALIAHTVNAAFDTVALAQKSTDAAMTKAGLLMKWIMDLRQSDEVLELSNKQTLSRILNSALGTSLQAMGSSDTNRFCEVVRTKFPALLVRWTDKPYEDSAGVLKACPVP